MDEIARKPQKFLIFNNLIFDGIADLFLTIGFIPYIFIFLSFSGYIADDFYANNLTLINTLLVFAQLALFLFLFTTIASLDNSKKTLKGAVYYTILGVLYYIAEAILIIVIENVIPAGEDSLTVMILETFMPLNYLFSIAAFLYLGYFLLYTPKKCENSKTKLVLFRLLGLIPVAYIVVSYVLLSISNYSFFDAPLLLSISFSGQYFFQEVCGLVLVFLLYLNSVINKYRIKNNKSALNFSQLQKNIIVCAVIAIFSITDWIISSLVDDISYYCWEVGTMKYIICLLPLFFLFKNDDSEIKHKKIYFAFDWYYTLIFVLLAIVYIILYLAKFGFNIR